MSKWYNRFIQNIILKSVNFTNEKTSLEGKNFIWVPVFFDFPIIYKGLFEFPSLKSLYGTKVVKTKTI